MQLCPTDCEDLRHARRLLEKPGIAARIIKVMGLPFEQGLRCLPDKYVGQIQAVCEKALRAALNFAVLTINSTGQDQSSDQFHQIAAAISGGIGGAIGLPALAIELPLSTTIMMRSIADIAREEGEDIRLIDTKLACLMVFALSGTTEHAALETGYYGIRAALSAAMSDATRFIA
ncbi:MAG: EcsC family protein, partial [Pseudomonadota bacterium]